MPTVPSAVTEFLSHRILAVAGVSRDGRSPANAILRRLKDEGYTVFAVNPRASSAEGQACFPSLDALPEKVEGVIAVTPPGESEALVRDCARLGIPRLWMHRSFGPGSVSAAAVEYGRAQGVEVLAGGCPMMFCGKVDPAHKCMRWVLRVTGKLPD
jgi:predicted CoA-binding protein